MNKLDPGIFNKKYLFDKYLKLDAKIVVNNGKEYYKIFLSRKIDKLEFEVKHLYYIPVFDNTNITINFFEILQILFHNGILLYTYLPPYSIHGKFLKPQFFIEKMDTFDYWKNMNDIQQKELLNKHLNDFKKYENKVLSKQKLEKRYEYPKSHQQNNAYYNLDDDFEDDDE
jgi:hypothetical protein